MKRNGTVPLSLPLQHPAWRRAAVKAAAAIGGQALRPPAAVALIAKACDCPAPLAREILAAAESLGLLRFACGRWTAEPATHASASQSPKCSEAAWRDPAASRSEPL